MICSLNGSRDPCEYPLLIKNTTGALAWVYQQFWDVLIQNSWSDSFIVFLPQWQIIRGKFYAL